jgi:hypothetical protein
MISTWKFMWHRPGHGEAGGNDAGRPLDEREAVVAVVGAQMRDAGLGGRGQLQADDVGGEAGGGTEVGDAGADVGDIGEGDHRPAQAKTGARSM